MFKFSEENVKGKIAADLCADYGAEFYYLFYEQGLRNIRQDYTIQTGV